MSEERFFRPEKKREEKGIERFQRLMWKSIQVAFRLLLLTLVLFLGHRLYIYLLEDSTFQLREVEVRGCRKVEEKTIRSLARIEGMPNLFTIELKEISRRVETHPWIEQVIVRKVFPNRLLIQIEERRPIAIIQLEDLYYIDSKGVIFSPVGARDEYNFPFLTGLNRQMMEKDSQRTKELIMKALEFMRIAGQEKVPPLEGVSEIHMEKSFGIQCFTQNEGVEVRMGWDHFGEKLRRLSLIWMDLQKRGLSAASIDCSDLKRMVVKKISPDGNGKGGDERWARRIR